MTIDTARLRVSTKALFSAFLTFGALMQVPAVNAAVTSMLAGHPQLTPLVSAVVGIYLLLHNPQVEQVLGIKETVEVKKTVETVSVAEPTTESK